jgi:hypothetical protein
MISVTKDNENRLLIFNYRARMGFLALGSNGKTILGSREEKYRHPDVCYCLLLLSTAPL